jgi:hypothetical protein
MRYVCVCYLEVWVSLCRMWGFCVAVAVRHIPPASVHTARYVLSKCQLSGSQGFAVQASRVLALCITFRCLEVPADNATVGDGVLVGVNRVLCHAGH